MIGWFIVNFILGLSIMGYYMGQEDRSQMEGSNSTQIWSLILYSLIPGSSLVGILILLSNLWYPKHWKV